MKHYLKDKLNRTEAGWSARTGLPPMLYTSGTRVVQVATMGLADLTAGPQDRWFLMHVIQLHSYHQSLGRIE